MTERRTQFEGEWADGSGNAVLDVGPLQDRRRAESLDRRRGRLARTA